MRRFLCLRKSSRLQDVQESQGSGSFSYLLKMWTFFPHSSWNETGSILVYINECKFLHRKWMHNLYKMTNFYMHRKNGSFEWTNHKRSILGIYCDLTIYMYITIDMKKTYPTLPPPTEPLLSYKSLMQLFYWKKNSRFLVSQIVLLLAFS